LLANAASSDKLYKINSIIVANVDGTNSADATVSWYDGSNDRHLVKTVAVPADTTLTVLGKDSMIYLEEGQSIRGGASANSDLEILICYEIIDDA
jgi:dienelactone hydrolase